MATLKDFLNANTVKIETSDQSLARIKEPVRRDETTLDKPTFAWVIVRREVIAASGCRKVPILRWGPRERNRSFLKVGYPATDTHDTGSGAESGEQSRACNSNTQRAMATATQRAQLTAVQRGDRRTGPLCDPGSVKTQRQDDVPNVVRGVAYHPGAAGEEISQRGIKPGRDSNLNLPVIGSLVYCESSALTHAATESDRICVPEENLEECNNMAALSALRFSCVPARDRLECLEKIKERQADFSPVDPEDMYIAAKLPDQDFQVFKEIRTKEEPAEEFRYEAVAVVHKNLDITSVQELRGLKSCHTGVGRNVGYKIPITKLTKMGVLGPHNDPDLTARENELKALSSFFTKACLVGKWSADPAHNTRLKSTYSNLCELCEHPEICDYPDKFSGYDGAIKCLAENGGEVAWTKVYYVKKHFGLPIGGVAPQTPVADVHPEDFAYLCPDGSKKPITGPACRWAARPWQGFLINNDLVSSVSDLRTQVSLANTEGVESNADWLNKVLTINNKTLAIDNEQPISPQAYLDKANYTDVIERDSGAPHFPVRFCVVSDVEKAKCQSLKVSAFSRDIRPAFDCVQEQSVEDCLKTIRDGGADVITLDGGEVHTAVTQYNLKPILSEQYGEHGGLYYAVAVVKKSSSYQSISDLRGAKSCHTGYGRTAGWNVPLYTLLSKNLIEKNICPYTKAVSDFFSGGSCVPGVLAPANNPGNNNPTKLCDLCAGNVDEGDRQKSHCAANSEEAYYSYTGAFRCLTSGGDVAFVKHTTVLENTVHPTEIQTSISPSSAVEQLNTANALANYPTKADGNNKESWASNLRSEDYELLCPDGGRKPVSQYSSCNLAQVPPHMVVTSHTKSDTSIETIRHALLSAADLYSKRPDLFKLFGTYLTKKDLLFKIGTGITSLLKFLGKFRYVWNSSGRRLNLGGLGQSITRRGYARLCSRLAELLSRDAGMNSATSLKAVEGETPVKQRYFEMLQLIKTCDHATGGN
uniref:(California timema) hypothetical protein n=1 Tax=Timema californicum TaxID=61474 RepID=A0A7R9JAE2_TIMCA|nr:unnamed protein product [Timema californicum]